MYISGLQFMTLASAGGAGFSMTPTQLRERLENSIIMREPLYRSEAVLLAANIRNLDPLHGQRFQDFADSIPSRRDRSGPANPAEVLPPTLQDYLVSDGFLQRATVPDRSSDLRNFLILLKVLDNPKSRLQVGKSSRSIPDGRYFPDDSEPPVDKVTLKPPKKVSPTSSAVTGPKVLGRLNLKKPIKKD